MKKIKKTRNYRSAASYTSLDPEARQRQLDNLKRGREKIKRSYKPSVRSKNVQEADIITFATEYLGLTFKERPAQEVLLRVLYSLSLNEEQLKIYNILTNNNEYESAEKTEAVWVLGARSGKSFLASIIALYEGTRNKWQKYINKGESAYIVIVSTRQKQSEQIIQANCGRILENSLIKNYLKDSVSTELTLINDIKIASFPCNSTAARGLPICCLVFDEVGHFYTEGVKADETIYNSLRPRMAQFPNAKTVLISTPAAKQGLLWNFFEQGFKVSGRFTVQGNTEFVNPVIPKEFLESEKNRDIDNYAREFDAQFCEKIETFFSYDLLESCFTLPGDSKYNEINEYILGIDASGLSGRDLFGLAISHRTGKKVIIDYGKSFDTKNLDMIQNEIKIIKDRYNLRLAIIDKYAKGYVRAFIMKLGLTPIVRPSLSDVYVNFKSLVITGNIELPINLELKNGLLSTVAYYSKSNNISISHPRTSMGHADLADAVVSAVYQSSRIQEHEESKQIVHYEGPGYLWVEDEDYLNDNFLNFRVEKYIE